MVQTTIQLCLGVNGPFRIRRAMLHCGDGQYWRGNYHLFETGRTLPVLAHGPLDFCLREARRRAVLLT